jgi:arylsulfatase A-like enzyme
MTRPGPGATDVVDGVAGSRRRGYEGAMLPALLLAALCPDPNGPATERGNVLILVADDLGVDQLACYGLGQSPAPTPNLDQLAASGVRFLNAWSQPTCSPTRATLQTGRYAFRTGIGEVIQPNGNGVGLPLDEVTLPEMLDLGTGGAYAHALIGKWHLGTPQTGGDLAPNLAGYGHFAGSLEGQIQHYDNWRRVVDGVAAPCFKYATTKCVDDALVWIYAQQEPWLCVVSFQAPHAPFHRPPASLHSQSLPPGVPGDSCTQPGPDPLPFYRAAVQAMDTEIGRLLATLPSGERARTTVLFLGDNGTESCVTRPPFSPQAKGSLYEGGVRVPLIVSGLGVTRPGVAPALVNTSDVFATVADLADVDLAATLPGVTLDSVSFVPCLQDPAARVREWVYADVISPNGAVQTFPMPDCPPGVVCQTALGLDGPGNAVLESCGTALYGAYGENLVPWRLSGAPSRANAWLLIGPDRPGWEPLLGAMLASNPPALVLPFVTGTDGTLARTTWTGSTSDERHYQFVVQDRSQPSGFAVTDALRMELLPTRMQAVRRARYKLIRLDPCREELYDLWLDPLENTNLLTRPLTPAERAAYDRLVLVLDTLG